MATTNLNKPKLVKPIRKLERDMYCRVCEQWRPHTWIGQQQFPAGRAFDLYNCVWCDATKSVEVK